MIVNFERQFVFIHIPKTGGTSLTDALRPPRTLLNRVRRRLGMDLGRAAAHPDTKHETWAEFMDQFTQRTGLPRERAMALRPVAFVRHPYERFASLHRYRLKHHADNPCVPEDLNAFADLITRNPFPWPSSVRSLKPQYAFLDGAPDPFVGRFEAMAEEIVRLEAFLGMKLNMPHLNYTDRGPGAEALSRKSRDILRERYAADFERFGYSA